MCYIARRRLSVRLSSFLRAAPGAPSDSVALLLYNIAKKNQCVSSRDIRLRYIPNTVYNRIYIYTYDILPVRFSRGLPEAGLNLILKLISCSILWHISGDSLSISVFFLTTLQHIYSCAKSMLKALIQPGQRVYKHTCPLLYRICLGYVSPVLDSEIHPRERHKTFATVVGNTMCIIIADNFSTTGFFSRAGS